MENIKVLIPIANGTEELEAVAVIDLLRRAGAGVLVVGLSERISTSHNIRILPDMLIDDIVEEEYDAIVIPGGKDGVEAMSKNKKILDLLRQHKNNGKLISAICAGPLVLKAAGVLDRITRFTSHPSVMKEFEGYNYVNERVARDVNLITSRGAGTAIEFALAIILDLYNSDVRDKVSGQIIYK